MSDEKIMLTAIAIIMTTALIIGVLCFGAVNNREEIRLDNLQNQKEELQKENDEMKEEIRKEEEEEIRKKIEPVNIDCENDLWEGDITVKVTMEIYNPFGEWDEITEKEVAYQLDHGARIINCVRN